MNATQTKGYKGNQALKEFWAKIPRFTCDKCGDPLKNDYCAACDITYNRELRGE